MFRSTTRLVATIAILGLTAFALPANAAAPVYSPGDVVTVDGASVIAPAAGRSVAISVDRVDAPSTTLVVSTDAAGNVTVGDSAPAAPTGEAAPNKCDDSAYTLIDGASWPGSYNWHYKSKSTPNELTKKKAKKELKAAVKNITTADNDCGMSDKVSATSDYKGSTTSSSDVNGSPLTCDGTPNGENVTEFGPIGTSGVLAATCTYSDGNTIDAASVLISTDFEWWTGGSCSGAYSVVGVQTHEYGHAFGITHVDESTHGNLTMSTNINAPCSDFEADLGKGDVLGLEDLY